MKFSIRVLQDQYGTHKAVCPALPGCEARGNTRAQAAGSIDEAIRGYIAALNNFVPDRVEHEFLDVPT